MSKIDTSSWKKFKLEDLFEKVQVEKINAKANDFPTEPTDEYVIPLLTAGAENQGFARYAKREQCPTILSNVISVSANGANTGISFYQAGEFAVLQDAYAVKLKDCEIPSEEVGLFLVSCLNKLMHGNFDWSNKAGWNNVKHLEISLPVTTQDVPDWDYMQERIAELEQERIAELEQERIAELEQYLVAAGLNDYTLTEDDLKVLSLSGSGRDEDGNPAAHAAVSKPMMPFVMHDVFNYVKVAKIPKKDVRLVPDDEFCVPVVYAKFGDNGIMYWGRKDEVDARANVISIVYNGAIAAGKVYAQEEPTGILAESYLIQAKNGDKIPFEANLYMSQVIEKTIYPQYSREFLAVWNDRVENNVIRLPIQTDDSGVPVIDEAKVYHPDGYVPDWEYMAAYIRAMEKLVIRDVVDYKDEFIRQHRLAVAGSGV